MFLRQLPPLDPHQKKTEKERKYEAESSFQFPESANIESPFPHNRIRVSPSPPTEAKSNREPLLSPWFSLRSQKWSSFSSIRKRRRRPPFRPPPNFLVGRSVAAGSLFCLFPSSFRWRTSLLSRTEEQRKAAAAGDRNLPKKDISLSL